MTLNVKSLLSRQTYAYCDQTGVAGITRFRYNVALYLSYLSIKFDDKIKGIARNFKHTFGLTCVQRQNDV